MKIVLMGPISTAGIAPYLYESPPPDFPSGTGGAPLMATLIGALLEQGHEVCAITCGGFWATRDNKPVSINGERFEFHCVPIRKHSMRPRNGHIGRILDMYAYERRLLSKILAEAKPDFVHAHWTYEYGMVAIDSGFPYLITAHDDPVAVLKFFRNGYRLIRYLMARSVLRRAKSISAVSEYLRGKLLGFAKAPIDVVPNPLDRRFLQTMTHSRPAPSALTDIRFVAVINGWADMKNPQAALLAFSSIRKKRSNVSCHLFGHDFQAGGTAQHWAESRGIAEGMVFHGPVSHAQLLDELKLATLMLHPSRLESCPMGIAEAMAMGLPVVGGKSSGGVAWMIDAGGLTVDINKPEEMADAALRLISNDDFYLQCSKAAVKRVQQFSPEVIVNQYQILYQKSIDAFEAKVQRVVSEPVLMPRGKA